MRSDIYLLVLSTAEREELEARVRSRKLRADDVRRARLVFMLAKGASYTAIQTALGCDSAFVARWKRRFLDERLAGPLLATSGSSRSETDPAA